MRKKKPRIASLDQVKISRDGEYAVIEYRDPSISTVHLQVGAAVHRMTDGEILDLLNATLHAQQEMAGMYRHVAVEVPPGRPQISYSESAGQWVPRGDVLRCVISDGAPDGAVTIWIDNRELSLAEFGRLLSTYAGWGMRIVFVPEDEVTRTPTIEVRDPVGDG